MDISPNNTMQGGCQTVRLVSEAKRQLLGLGTLALETIDDDAVLLVRSEVNATRTGDVASQNVPLVDVANTDDDYVECRQADLGAPFNPFEQSQ